METTASLKLLYHLLYQSFFTLNLCKWDWSEHYVQFTLASLLFYFKKRNGVFNGRFLLLRDYYPKIPDDKVSLVLVALKTDLRKDMPRKTIPSSETAKLARRIGTDYYHECSAKDENGYPDVQKVFQKAALATLARGQKKTKCFIL